MSRLARKPIKLPESVTVSQDGDFVLAKGPKGEKRVKLSPGVEVSLDGGNVFVKFDAKKKKDISLLGTAWALVKNAIHGVKEGFLKILEVEGVGYRPQLEGKILVMHLGYAVPIKMNIPEGVSVEIEKNVIKISGIDKELVGQFAADVRSLKKPEPYKGKGIRYKGEVIRRKAGKKAGSAAA